MARTSARLKPASRPRIVIGETTARPCTSPQTSISAASGRRRRATDSEMGHRRQIAGSRLLITGASQGIGRALAIEAARRGAMVLATARGEGMLRALESENGSIKVLR